MTDPASNVNDEARLAALRASNVLDTPAEASFDDIVQLASAVCGTPIALVSLVDRDRQWFKAKIGIDASETPVEQAVCAHAIGQLDPLVITDMTADARTLANPLVTEDPHMRFYAGAPIVDEHGNALGTVCAIDTVTRPEGLTDAQKSALEALARQAMALIALRREIRERDAAIEHQWRESIGMRRRVEASEAARLASQTSVERARNAQEAGRVGTFEVDVETGTTLVSAEFCRLFGLPVQPHYAAEELQKVIVEEDRHLASTEANRRSGSGILDVEYRIRRADDGRVRWVSRRAGYERSDDGEAVRLFGTVHDVTDRRVANLRIAALLALGDRLRDVTTTREIAVAAAQVLGTSLLASRAGYASIDPIQGNFDVVADWTDGTNAVESVAGRTLTSALSVTLGRLTLDHTLAVANVPAAEWLGVDRTTYAAMHARAIVNIPLFVRGALVGVLFVNQSEPRVWTEGEIEFAHGVADRTYAAIAKIEAERSQHVLNEELSHRLKNSLAMVQAIASQTLRHVPERGPVENFESRLHALGVAHDVLLQQSWTAARVHEIVVRALESLGLLDRIDVDGPNVLLGPKATLAFSLMLHELATNALKYGAWSVDGGRVSLRWRIDGEGDDANVVLNWSESGGPPAAEPERKGFGSRLIGMGLLGTGGSTVRYQQTGLEAEFTARLTLAQRA